MGGANFPWRKVGESELDLGVDVGSRDGQSNGLCGLADWTVRTLLPAFVRHLILVTLFTHTSTIHSYSVPFSISNHHPLSHFTLLLLLKR